MEILISYKGRYTPQNPKKYKGNAANIVYRSLWERKFMKFCDESESVLEWSSEEIVVPYLNPFDNRVHRYFVDFWMKVKEKDGSLKCKMVEIKPHKQTTEPVKPARTTRKYLSEVETYIINKQKWESAEQFCSKNGWEFLILTEKHLFKNGK